MASIFNPPKYFHAIYLLKKSFQVLLELSTLELQVLLAVLLPLILVLGCLQLQRGQPIFLTIPHSHILLLNMPLLHVSFEASLKTCNTTSCFPKFICKHLGTSVSEICSNSLHQCINFYLKRSFCSSPCSHNSCIIIFPCMISGAQNPNGSNSVAILLRAILLLLLPFSSLFDTVNVNCSFYGNHCTLKVLISAKCFSYISTPSVPSLHGICSKSFAELEIHFAVRIPAVFHNLDIST